MAANILSVPRMRSAVRRFAANGKGSAAVQFAFIAPLFFFTIFAIIETTLIFFAGQILETGTRDSARFILTHQAQDSAEKPEDFKNDLCNRVSMLLSCSGIALDVRSYDPTKPIILYNPSLDANGNFTPDTVYAPPDPGSSNIVIVRAFYQWPLMIPHLGSMSYNLTDIGSRAFLLSATAAFRVEPGNN